MNRYQFEDLISSYIENDISLKKRKEFQEYIKNNIDAKNKVDSIISMVKKINNTPRIKSSPDFNQSLLEKISSKPLRDKNADKSIFGFTPIHASMMSGLIIAFVVLIVLIFERIDPLIKTDNKLYTTTFDSKVGIEKQSSKDNIKDSLDNFVKNEEDSVKNRKKDFSKKIQFVNE